MNHTYSESIKKGNYEVINCQDCGYWHVFPMPTSEVLEKYYKEKYYQTLTETNNRTMTDKISDPDSFYQMQHEDRLININCFLPWHFDRKVLDLGCGYGDFLAFLKSYGWQGLGIEVSEDACKICEAKDIEIIHHSFENLEELNLPAYPLVILNAVLEHLPEPSRILYTARKHLLPQGTLIIHSPNDFNPLQMIVNKTVSKPNYWIHPPEHLNYWTVRSLQTYLVKQGFKILHTTVTFPLELFILLGEDYITTPELGRTIHLKRIAFEKMLGSLKDDLYVKFAEVGIGREVEIFCTYSNKE